LANQFPYLEARLSGIDARLAEATVEEDRKQIFRSIENLERGFEGLNDEMHRAQRRWLGVSADGVLRRSDPNREPLGEDEMALEVATIGEGKHCEYTRCCRVLCCAAEGSRRRRPAQAATVCVAAPPPRAPSARGASRIGRGCRCYWG
jgi:hypothetical protein